MNKTILIIGIFVLFSFACKKNEYVPGSSIAGIRASINKILVSPLAFDGAVVVVEGIARDIEEKYGEYENSRGLSFKLTDLYGNYININAPSGWDIVDKDYVILGGKYDRKSNSINAEQLEVTIYDKDETKKRLNPDPLQ